MATKNTIPQWTVTKLDNTGENQARGFQLNATEKVTRDRVAAFITQWDEDFAGEAEIYGLPDGLPLESVWDLGHIRPRKRLAPGGTTAILRELTRLADLEEKWLIVSVQTDSEVNDQAAARLMRRAGFTAPDPIYPMAMRRAPGAPNTLHP